MRVRVALGGLAGSVALLVCGLATSRFPPGSGLSAWLNSLHGPNLEPWLGAVLGFGGVVLLTLAWWGLRHLLDPADPAGGVRLVRRMTALWILPLLLAPPLVSPDGWSYAADGRLVARGLSPYVATADRLGPVWQHTVSSMWRTTPSPYGPLALWLYGVGARIWDSPLALVLAIRVLTIGGLALMAICVPGWARRLGVDPARASWLTLASPFMLLQGVGALHIDLIAGGLMVTALTVARQRRWVGSAVLTGLAAAVKFPAGLLAPGIVLLTLEPGSPLSARVIRLVQVAAVAALVLLGIGVVTGLGQGWVQAAPKSLTPPSHFVMSVPDQLGRLIGSVDGGAAPARRATGHTAVAVARYAGEALIAVLVAIVALRRRPATDRASVELAGWLGLACLVLLPETNPWYFLLPVPVLCVVATIGLRRPVVVAMVTTLGLTSVAGPEMHLKLLTNWSRPVDVVVPLLALLVAALARRRGAWPAAPATPVAAGQD